MFFTNSGTEAMEAAIKFARRVGHAKGRTELDNYTGYLLALAGGRPCPLNRAVYTTLRRLEGERRVAGLGVLDELLPS